MSRLAVLALGLLLACCNAGCHNCSPCMDCYGDLIDDIGDHHPTLDCLYYAPLDVSRIGQPDWCACPFNRWIGGCVCDEWCYSGSGHCRCAACGRHGSTNQSFSHAMPYPHYSMPNRVAPRMLPADHDATQQLQEAPPPALLPPPAPTPAPAPESAQADRRGVVQAGHVLPKKAPREISVSFEH